VNRTPIPRDDGDSGDDGDSRAPYLIRTQNPVVFQLPPSYLVVHDGGSSGATGAVFPCFSVAWKA